MRQRDERVPKLVLYLLALAALQGALSRWWLWISDGGGDKRVAEETAFLLLVSGPSAWFAHGATEWQTFAISTLVLLALSIPAALVHQRSKRVVLLTAAIVWYALCGVLPVLILI